MGDQKRTYDLSAWPKNVLESTSQAGPVAQFFICIAALKQGLSPVLYRYLSVKSSATYSHWSGSFRWTICEWNGTHRDYFAVVASDRLDSDKHLDYRDFSVLAVSQPTFSGYWILRYCVVFHGPITLYAIELSPKNGNRRFQPLEEDCESCARSECGGEQFKLNQATFSSYKVLMLWIIKLSDKKQGKKFADFFLYLLLKIQNWRTLEKIGKKKALKRFPSNFHCCFVTHSGN